MLGVKLRSKEAKFQGQEKNMNLNVGYIFSHVSPNPEFDTFSPDKKQSLRANKQVDVPNFSFFSKQAFYIHLDQQALLIRRAAGQCCRPWAGHVEARKDLLCPILDLFLFFWSVGCW